MTLRLSKCSLGHYREEVGGERVIGDVLRAR